jgi:hypothetical protein
MKIDEYGCIVMEHVNWPGSIGDSAAESGRYEHLKQLLGDYVAICNLEDFVTPLGYVRHPTAPTDPDWREKDFSADQSLPLYLAWRKSGNYVRTNQMERRYKRDWFRTGNGDLLTPGLFAEMYANWLRVPLLLGQIAIFKLPVRYNDEKQGFEANEGSVCDYLNYIHVSVYAPAWVRRLGPSKQKLKQAIASYYFKEIMLEKDNPRIAVKIYELYEQVLERYWT